MRLLFAAALAVGLVLPVHAQTSFPSRTITLIVPFPPGGPVDTVARLLAERPRPILTQPVIVENISGAGATIGTGRVARAAPDGYTLGIGNWTSHVGSPAIYPAGYDIIHDFEPVALLPMAPTMIVGRANLPAGDVRELIGWLKANPDKASAGTIGAGSPSHVGGVFFQRETGTRFQFVPYRGSAPVMQDLVSGQIDLRFGSEGSQVLPYLRRGALKGYAMMSRSRWAAAPEIPTIDESGVPGLYISLWNGFWVPRGTPKDVIARLNAAVVEALADPAMRQRFTELGFDVPAREQQTPEALGAFHQAEIAKWWPIIKAANIKPE
jgi:tripartite-type tricarboxylate transporter receptor subunit TctC